MSDRQSLFMTQPPEPVLFDTAHPCAYLPGRVARLPYRRPAKNLEPAAFDERLAQGDRRNGVFLYRTACPSCRACEPMRLVVADFRPDATQRRMKRRGDGLLKVKIGRPVVDRERVRLFNLHRDQRGLAMGDGAVDERSYAEFLTHSCCDTWEFSYWEGERLVGVAIADLGWEAMSAVYCYYEPSFRPVSLGTYSVLREVQYCQDNGYRYLYLGFYIAASEHMSYKTRFRPHERLLEGSWVRFE